MLGLLHRIFCNPTPDVGFVACIEGGVLEKQALLLFESIRLFTGRFRKCRIYAFSPRAGRPISAEAKARLRELKVEYIDAVLNTECLEYGSTNRIVAGAYVEANTTHEILVVLDSDTLFLREPSEFLLPAGIDAAARPVDQKGMCTAGPEDACDLYWRQLCENSGVDYESIPWVTAFVDGSRVKASYNGGLAVVRRELGILQRCSEFFFSSVRAGMKPNRLPAGFRTGVSWVQAPEAAMWGSSQAVLSLAMWSRTQRVRELPPSYNYPLHLHSQVDPAAAREWFPKLVHVHYHWLLEKDAVSTNPLFVSESPLSQEQRKWLARNTPI